MASVVAEVWAAARLAETVWEVSESWVPRRIHQCLVRRGLGFATRKGIGFISRRVSGMSLGTRLLLRPVASFLAS
ncbi:hypothetical protein ACFZAV_40440 [Streptomyces sp. NPDC008343]|uniref:hypothetical protein n=1 Tax=Streptomyces sp. NPDC008343 TaxID=3364828 RepID=UPI0036EB7C70